MGGQQVDLRRKGSGPWYWHCYSATCQEHGKGRYKGWTREVDLRRPLLNRSGTMHEIRILFAFDPWRSAVLLVAGDKSRKWNRWYTEAIPHAEQLYEIYLKERADEEKGR